MRNYHLYFLITFLTLCSVSIFAYKHFVLGLPLKPNEKIELWTIEEDISFVPKENVPIRVSTKILNAPPGFNVIGEDFISRNYGSTTRNIGDNKILVWSKRLDRGNRILYYRATVYKNSKAPPVGYTMQAIENRQQLIGPERSAANALLEPIREQSADVATFAAATVRQLNNKDNTNAQFLLDRDYSAKNLAKTAITVLNIAHVRARVVFGLRLKDTKMKAELEPWIEAYNGKNRIYINPTTGALGLPPDYLLWWHGADVKLINSHDSVDNLQVNFAVSRNMESLLNLSYQHHTDSGSLLMRFSTLNLPLQVQQVYKVMLAVPIGALIIIILRNFIGIPTFGTFMPVLIALAFRDTELAAGLILFTLIVSLGLLVRFYLEHVRLLLVPRLAAVLTTVVLIMMMITVVCNQLGIATGLSIALFPMVIITMTIERICIVWDERGPVDAIKAGAGSLFAACLCYIAMSNDYVRYLVFVFPELLLLVLVISLVFGQYTGYRVTELYRFRTLVE